MENNKVALITGASAGIGKEFASIHASHGGDLVIVARREDKLNELKEMLEKQHQVNIHVIARDLAAPDATKAIYDEVKQAGIEID
ncbi:MAG: SDR family NAD(P)-dependent oxidoreductase, partial [Bacteroidota bacterium]